MLMKKNCLKIILLGLMLSQNLNLLKAENEPNNTQTTQIDEAKEAPETSIIKKSIELPTLDEIEKLIERNDDGEVIRHIYYSTLLFANCPKYIDQIKTIIEKLKQKKARENKSINFFSPFFKATITGFSSLFLGTLAYWAYMDKDNGAAHANKILKNSLIGCLSSCCLLLFLCTLSEIKKINSKEGSESDRGLRQAYAIKLALIDLKRILSKGKDKKQELITPAVPVLNTSKYGRSSK